MSMLVAVVPHRPSWSAEFEAEKARLLSTLEEGGVAIHHIGSTSIPGIMAKPIIDILVEVKSVQIMDTRCDRMEALGYECKGEFGLEGRRYFRKDSSEGVRTHHVHAFKRRSPDALRHLAFRDYLIAHPDRAEQYSELKRQLVERHPNDMESYIEGKDTFIKKVEAEAVRWWSSRC